MTAHTQARTFNYQAIEDAWDKGKIAVLDSMPGSGKTTAITNFLRDKDPSHVIFVSPFKSEVEQELPKRKLKGLHYVHPRSGKGGKVSHLKELITKGDNSSGNKLHRITCTHSAFTRLTSESFDQLGYCEGNWFYMLPIELLTKAKRVIVMTHGFENSFMHCWLKHHKVEHHYIDNEKLGLVPEVTLKQQLKSNLKLIELTKKLNDLAETRNFESFSMSHWKRLVTSKEIEDLKSSLNHIIKEKLRAGTSDIFWTCPKRYRTEVERLVPKLRGKITLQKQLEVADVNEDFIEHDDLAESDEQDGKTHSSWLPCNIKARNDFGHITNCLYAFSLNPPPSLVNLLTGTSGIGAQKIKATFKLNNLLQFIYRGSIRQNKPMNLCIIPADTRALLDDFLKHY
jgi:hypothetical protein